MSSCSVPRAIIAKTRIKVVFGRGRRHPRPSSKMGLSSSLTMFLRRSPFRRRLNQLGARIRGPFGPYCLELDLGRIL